MLPSPWQQQGKWHLIVSTCRWYVCRLGEPCIGHYSHRDRLSSNNLVLRHARIRAVLTLFILVLYISVSNKLLSIFLFTSLMYHLMYLILIFILCTWCIVGIIIACIFAHMCMYVQFKHTLYGKLHGGKKIKICISLTLIIVIIFKWIMFVKKYLYIYDLILL